VYYRDRALYPSGREALLEYRLTSLETTKTVLSVDTITCDVFPRSSWILESVVSDVFLLTLLLRTEIVLKFQKEKLFTVHSMTRVT